MRIKRTGATIPDAIVEGVIARRGSEDRFADLDPAFTALVVIDLQHALLCTMRSDTRCARRCTTPRQSAGAQILDGFVPPKKIEESA